MSDRTWNSVDARLYEEDWSQGAIILCACLLARCPNQYGVFDMPWGFLKLFFKGLYTRQEIEAYVVEWEASGFAKLYRGRQVIWIVKKWKRSGNPSELHWKGLENVLMDFPEVREDFMAYYKPLYKGMETPFKGDKQKPKPLVNPESESESDPDTETTKGKKQIPGKPGVRVKVGPIENVIERDRELFPEIYAFVEEIFPEKWTKKPKELKAQADALRLICRQDTDGPDESIFDCLRWAKTDIIEGAGHREWGGWGRVFNSFRSLRTRQEGVAKFEKVWTSYQASLKKPRSRSADLDDETKFTGVTGRKEL